MKKLFEHFLVWSGAFEIFFSKRKWLDWINELNLTLFLVGGIFYGWTSYIFILKEENVFLELCTESNGTSNGTSISSCVEQDKKFNSIFVLGILLSNVFTILYGIILDSFGMTQARVATGIPLTAGLTMMIFYKDRVALEIGTYLLSISCCGTLITNYAIQV